ncbi:MAG: fimbrillin family protein [Candidatus Cryptobacteroides sp.]
MKRVLTYSLLAALCCLCTLSCRKDDGPAADDGAIAFLAEAADAVPVAKAGAGDGIVKTDGKNLTGKSFGVYGVWNDLEESTGGNNVFLQSTAQEVSYNSTETKWEYSPVQYWKLNKFYRFRAYHPYSGDSFSVNASSSADNILIEYNIIPGKEDLLVGFAAVEATVTNIKEKVKFDFQHALCGLQFKIALKNVPEIADGDKDFITEFHIEGLIPTGTLRYTYDPSDVHLPIIEWNATYYDSGSYFSWTGAHEFPKYNGSDNAVDIFDGTDQMVFCIPQTCSSSNDKPTTVHFKTLGGGDADNSAVLPKLEWEPGKIYIYTLLVNKSDLEVVVSIKDWKEIQSSEDVYL